MKQKKLALSLSGGGARAFCYFGFMRALEKNDIQIDLITAHSGAAIFMCYLASNLSDDEIITEFSKFRYFNFISLGALPKGGLYSVERMANFLRKYTKGKDISELPYKTTISTSDVTDYDHPLEVVNKTGDMAKISAISSLVPPLFELYYDKETGRILADGGYTSLYGAKWLRQDGAEVIIGLYPDGLYHTKIPFFAKGFARIFKSISTLREDFERVTDPVDLEVRNFSSKAGLGDFKMAREMFDSGFQKALDLLPEIKELVY